MASVDPLPIEDGEYDVHLNVDAIVTEGAEVLIDGVRQLNVTVDSATNDIIFNHRRGDMRLNSKGEGAHSVSVKYTGPITEVIVSYGQSNNFGLKTADLSPNDTVNQSATDILMLNGAKNSLVAATSQITSDEGPTAGDSDCMIDLANYYRAYYNARGTLALQQVLSLGGLGASAITDLGDGTTPFTNWKADFTATCNLILASGRTPHVSHILYVQGEKDVNTSVEAGWGDRLVAQIYDPMIAHIKAATGQTDDPIMQLTVLSMHSNYTTNGNNLNEIAIEQLAAQNLRPGRIKATNFSGWFEHVTDGIHFSGEGQRLMRQMQAKFMAYTNMQPLTVSHAKRTDSVIGLYVEGGIGDLVYDYSMHASTTAKGIRVFNSSAAAVTISSVTLDNVNRKIDVTLADGGTNGPYTIDGSYFSNNELGGGQYHANIVPITDSDTTHDGSLSDSSSLGNPSLANPLMPFNLTVSES